MSCRKERAGERNSAEERDSQRFRPSRSLSPFSSRTMNLPLQNVLKAYIPALCYTRVKLTPSAQAPNAHNPRNLARPGFVPADRLAPRRVPEWSGHRFRGYAESLRGPEGTWLGVSARSRGVRGEQRRGRRGFSSVQAQEQDFKSEESTDSNGNPSLTPLAGPTPPLAGLHPHPR